MNQTALQKLLATLTGEFERCVLLAMMALLGGSVYFGVARIQRLLNRPSVRPRGDKKVESIFDHGVAWRFIGEQDPFALVRPHSLQPSKIPKPGAQIASTDNARPPILMQPRKWGRRPPPAAAPAAPAAEPPEPLTQVIQISEPAVPVPVPEPPTPADPGDDEPPAPKPRRAPTSYLAYNGFMRSPNGHMMACVTRVEDNRPSPMYLEVGKRFEGLLVTAVEKRRVVLKRGNGQKVTLTIGEKYELRETGRGGRRSL